MLARHVVMWDGPLENFRDGALVGLKGISYLVLQNLYWSSYKEREFAPNEIEKKLNPVIIDPSNSNL